MYEFAYNEIVEESSQSMRAQEARALDRVLALLREAQACGPRSRQGIERALSAAHAVDSLSRRPQRGRERAAGELAGAAYLHRHLGHQGDRTATRRRSRRPLPFDRNQPDHSRRIELRLT